MPFKTFHIPYNKFIKYKIKIQPHLIRKGYPNIVYLHIKAKTKFKFLQKTTHTVSQIQQTHMSIEDSPNN